MSLAIQIWKQVKTGAGCCEPFLISECFAYSLVEAISFGVEVLSTADSACGAERLVYIVQLQSANWPTDVVADDVNLVSDSALRGGYMTLGLRPKKVPQNVGKPTTQK